MLQKAALLVDVIHFRKFNGTTRIIEHLSFFSFCVNIVWVSSSNLFLKKMFLEVRNNFKLFVWKCVQPKCWEMALQNWKVDQKLMKLDKLLHKSMTKIGKIQKYCSENCFLAIRIWNAILPKTAIRFDVLL